MSLAWSQDPIKGFFLNEDQDTILKIDEVNLIQADFKLDSILKTWRQQNFLAACMDKMDTAGQKITYHLYKGQDFFFEEINLNDLPPFVQELGVSTAKKTMSMVELEQFFSNILKKTDDLGYPFAKIKMDDIKVKENIISSTIKLDLNKRVVFDSLIIVGDAKINENLIRNLLSLKKGEPYKESTINRISNKLREIPYISQSKSPEFVFKKNGVDVYLYLKNKSANRFSGIIGFLPNSVNGETNITGDVDLSLVNTLRIGERLKFKWQRIRPEVQDLNVATELPFLFNTPFGLNASLDIFRQDTSLLEVKSNIGLLYNFGSQDYFKIYFSAFSSDRLENTQQANDLGGSNYDSYGAGILLSDLDYIFNPRKGYSIDFSADVGTRFFDPPSLSDSVLINLPEESNVYNINANLNYFIPSGKRGVFALKLSAASKLNPNLLSNELLRLGGNNSLRGFDEESLRKSSYAYLNVEYRIITDLNSNIFLFANSAWTETRLFNSYDNDFPYGFGAGANFDTNAGIFSLSYALGAQNGNTIQTNQGKVHFGFKSLF